MPAQQLHSALAAPASPSSAGVFCQLGIRAAASAGPLSCSSHLQASLKASQKAQQAANAARHPPWVHGLLAHPAGPASH